MGNINGKKNQDRDIWAKEKRCNRYVDSGRCRYLRCKGGRFGDKSQRTNRKNGSFSRFFNGDTSAGGMFRHLISYHREQVAALDLEIQRISTEKSKHEVKIQEIEALLSELNYQLQE